MQIATQISGLPQAPTTAVQTQDGTLARRTGSTAETVTPLPEAQPPTSGTEGQGQSPSLAQVLERLEELIRALRALGDQQEAKQPDTEAVHKQLKGIEHGVRDELKALADKLQRSSDDDGESAREAGFRGE